MAALKEITRFVRVERDHLQGYRSLKTIESFFPGEVVLREKPLVQCDDDSDVDRLLAFSYLDPGRKVAAMQVFADVEVYERGCDDEPEDFESTLAEVQQLGVTVDRSEARQILSKWRYCESIDRTGFFEKAGTLRHSCSANVELRREFAMADGAEDAGAPDAAGMLTVTARVSINHQTRIGPWLLEDTSLWWKGADLRSLASQQAGFIKQACCCCERCQGDDTCRAIKCPGCADFHKRLKAASTLMLVCSSAFLMATFIGWRRVVSGAAKISQGEVVRSGKLKRWRCNRCDFNGSDVAIQSRIKLEESLVEQLSDLSSIDTDQLRSWADAVGQRIGLGHWLACEIWMEMYRREVDGHDGTTFTAVLAALRVCEWFVARNLSRPPLPVIDQLEEMTFRTLEFLNAGVLGVRDLRVLYVRAIDMFRTLLERIDRSLLDRFKPYAGAAQNLSRRCGFCSKFFREDFSAIAVAQAQAELDNISADDFGQGGQVLCSRCGILGYCDIGCQTSDWRRHRHFCLPMEVDFKSSLVAEMLSLT